MQNEKLYWRCVALNVTELIYRVQVSTLYIFIIIIVVAVLFYFILKPIVQCRMICT